MPHDCCRSKSVAGASETTAATVHRRKYRERHMLERKACR
jgi:hypothetical protein